MNWFIEKWSTRSWLTLLLLPASLIFYILIIIRAKLYSSSIICSAKPSVPVIIVGNIYIGGTGKTPIVIWLSQHLKKRGYNPGIISRGYGGDSSCHPMLVKIDSDPRIVGDEPLLIAQKVDCPLIVGGNRSENATTLVDKYGCDVVISDDGLQHYKLQRDLEIVVFDGIRGKGNGLVFPAGPLREPMSRLKNVDYVLLNGGSNEISGYSYLMKLCNATNLVTRNVISLDSFANQRVHAVAGIGNPQRFFNALSRLGIIVIEHPFADHMQYNESNLSFSDSIPVLMTEKDGVKCMDIAEDNWWVVPVELEIEQEFIEHINSRFNKVIIE